MKTHICFILLEPTGGGDRLRCMTSSLTEFRSTEGLPLMGRLSLVNVEQSPLVVFHVEVPMQVSRVTEVVCSVTGSQRQSGSSGWR
jgi:hypothetical protein